MPYAARARPRRRDRPARTRDRAHTPGLRAGPARRLPGDARAGTSFTRRARTLRHRRPHRDAAPGPWDAVVSALAIHHLEDPAKRDLFERVHASLSPGGVFVNAEQVKGPTPLLDRAYVDWHERSARALGVSTDEWALARERQGFDRLAGVEAQLAWLRTAGFADVDCLFKDHLLAVLIARRSGPR